MKIVKRTKISINGKSEEVKPKLSDFAGSWKMSDAEAKKLKKEIRDLWKTWKI